MVVASPSSSSFEEAVQRSFRHASSFFDHENGCSLLMPLKRTQVGDPRSASVERGRLSLKPLTHVRKWRCSLLHRPVRPTLDLASTVDVAAHMVPANLTRNVTAIAHGDLSHRTIAPAICCVDTDTKRVRRSRHFAIEK